jgi:hypothetical protein
MMLTASLNKRKNRSPSEFEINKSNPSIKGTPKRLHRLSQDLNMRVESTTVDVKDGILQYIKSYDSVDDKA